MGRSATLDTIGSLAWAEGGNGRLIPAERRSLRGPMLRTMLAYTSGRLRLALGLRSRVPLRLGKLTIPDSALAKEAETELEESVSPALVGHSHRTFLFAWGLAQLDGARLDLEHLYVTSLLHDIALETPRPDCCFAVAGAGVTREVAGRAGCDAATAEHLAETVALHITPGLDAERFPLAVALTSGALVDLTGSRLWDLEAGFVRRVVERHPRDGFAQALGRAWREEARVFPEGRAAAVERFSRFSFFVRHAPFEEA